MATRELAPTSTELSREVEERLAAGEIEKIEESWLARLERAPQELDYFIAVADALGRAGEGDTALFLLELLDEHLSDGGHWRQRLELLRRVGPLLVEEDDLHPQILRTLEHIHGHRPSYAQLVDKVGLERAIDDIPKIWKKVERLDSLVSYDVGAIVEMEGKGAGRVLEVNMELESFKVEFEDGLELRIGFGGVAKLLKPLETEHVLRRKIEEPEVLAELAREQPSELLRIVLESHDKPLIGAEIKRVLSGVVPPKAWNKWWTAARKHPQVVAASGGRRAYSWLATSADAHDAVWEAFEAADPLARIEMLRREGDRDPDLKRRMARALAKQAGVAAGSAPGLACEIYLGLERSGVDPVDLDWSPRSLIIDLESPRDLFAGIRDRGARERAYEIAREARSDWPELYVEFLWQEENPRALDLLANALLEHSPELFSSFFDQLLSQPRRNPAAFTWLAERAAERPEWLARNPIRLLQQILSAFGSHEFASVRAARLVPLADSGGTLPRLLDYLDEDQAAQAHTAVERTPSLESYQREPLLNAIALRFPSLRQSDGAPLYATREAIAARHAELKELAEKEIPANRRAIEEARELGDLRENFEYKSARQRHEYLSSRAAALDRDLARVRPIDPSQVNGKEVVIGSRVRLLDADGKERRLTILGPWDSDPERDVLSNESEMAQSLLGRGPGESVELAGVGYRIESIEPFS